jgi:hypothetical protein
MTIKHNTSKLAIDWGTEGEVTDNGLRHAIGILRATELVFEGYDFYSETAIPDDTEIEEANEIVSVIAMLQRQLDTRQGDKS